MWFSCCRRIARPSSARPAPPRVRRQESSAEGTPAERWPHPSNYWMFVLLQCLVKVFTPLELFHITTANSIPLKITMYILFDSTIQGIVLFWSGEKPMSCFCFQLPEVIILLKILYTYEVFVLSTTHIIQSLKRSCCWKFRVVDLLDGEVLWSIKQLFFTYFPFFLNLHPSFSNSDQFASVCWRNVYPQT